MRKSTFHRGSIWGLKKRTFLKQVGLSLGILVAGSSLSAQHHSFNWAVGMGGTGQDIGFGITTDAQGYVYHAGWFSSTASFGSELSLTSLGGTDVYVSKLDSTGKVLWAKQMGGTGGDNALGVASDDQSNIYVTGGFSGTATFGTTSLTSKGGTDVYISKLDKNGNILWTKAIGSTGGDEGTSITTDKQGNILVIGHFAGTADFGATSLKATGADDIFITKLDNSGNFIWSAAMGSTTTDVGYAIATDNNNNIYATGTFQGSVDFDPGTGSSILKAAGTQDAFVLKLTKDGGFVWAQRAGGVEVDDRYCLTLDASNNIYITGLYSGKAEFGAYALNARGIYDGYVAKLDNSGKFLWVKSLGGKGYDGPGGVVTDKQGNVYVTGYFNEIGYFGSKIMIVLGSYDIFTCKLDPSNGDVIWANKMGSLSYDLGYGMAIDKNDNIYVTGGFNSKCDFDPAEDREYIVASKGSYDVFVVRLQSNCTFTTASVTSKDTLCVGDSLNLVASVGSKFDWNGPNGFMSKDKEVFVGNAEARFAGTYTVTVTNSFGCVDEASINIVVNQKPVITASSNSPVCEGQTLNLEASGAASYTWTGGDGYTSTNQNPTIEKVTMAQKGDFIVVAKGANGCKEVATVSVWVDPLPEVDFSFNVSEKTVAFNNKTLNADSLDWDYGDGNHANNPKSHKYNYDSEGTYTVTLTAFNKCGEHKLTKTVNIGTTGIDQHNAFGSMNFAPNPFSNELKLHYNYKNDGVIAIQIVDIMGRTIAQGKYDLSQNGASGIDLSEHFANAKSGVYFIKIAMDNGASFTKKIIKSN